MRLVERFWDNVKKTDSCWLWQGPFNQSGYGVFSLWPSTNVLVHRFAYVLEVGSIDYRGGPKERLHVMHRCDTRSCVNPSHLRLGTALDNIRDAWAKGRVHPGGGPKKLSWEKVREIRSAYLNQEWNGKHPTIRMGDIAWRYGVHETTISNILTGKTWKEEGGYGEAHSEEPKEARKFIKR